MHIIPSFRLRDAVCTEQVSEAAKQISTLKAREDEQRKRRQSAEEETDKIRKVRRTATARWETHIPAYQRVGNPSPVNLKSYVNRC